MYIYKITIEDNMKKFLMIAFIISSVMYFITGSPVSAETQDGTRKNLVDDTYVSIGAGLAAHLFSKSDDFRKGSMPGFKGSDDVNYAAGFQANAEVNLSKLLALNLPVGVNPGYRFQYLGVTREYTATVIATGVSSKITQKFGYFNHIAYLDFLYPVGSKYLVLGAETGCGLSTFKYTVSGTGLSKTNDSVNGLIVPIGVFLDWGADGVGGRVGYDYIVSKYGKINGKKPSFDGHQLYANFRYAY